MAKLDPFTLKRLVRFVEDFRARSGQLPAVTDFERSGFTREQVDEGVKMKAIEQFYVTLTNGTVVKGFKVPGN